MEINFTTYSLRSIQLKLKQVIHNISTKSGKDVDVRTMEGGSGGDKRAVFNTPGTNSPRTPNGKTPTGTKEQIRKDSHLMQKKWMKQKKYSEIKKKGHGYMTIQFLKQLL